MRIISFSQESWNKKLLFLSRFGFRCLDQPSSWRVREWRWK